MLDELVVGARAVLGVSADRANDLVESGIELPERQRIDPVDALGVKVGCRSCSAFRPVSRQSVTLFKSSARVLFPSQREATAIAILSPFLAPHPVSMARAAFPRLSHRDRTSSTTVIIVPPCDIGCKVSHQLIRRREGVWPPGDLGVPVIALSPFVVIAHNASLFDDVRHTVFEPVH